MQIRVLIAEDEISIAKALKIMLEKEKYSVDIVHDGQEAFEFITCAIYDAIVLDIMMPKMDGITLLRKIRELRITTPVLFLTAKAEIEDRVAGLDAGADDYLSKPFATSEFLARVRALARRSDVYTPALIRYGNVILDCGRFVISTTSGKTRLNNKEFQLMEMFIRHPGQIFSTEHLMDRIWGTDSSAELDVVWTYIGFLRRKLRELSANVEIRTIRGAGYTLEEMTC